MDFKAISCVKSKFHPNLISFAFVLWRKYLSSSNQKDDKTKQGKTARLPTSQSEKDNKKMPFSIPSGSMHHQHWRQQRPSRPTSFGTHLPGENHTATVRSESSAWYLLIWKASWTKTMLFTKKIGFPNPNMDLETWFGGCKRSKPNCWVQPCHDVFVWKLPSKKKYLKRYDSLSELLHQFLQ